MPRKREPVRVSDILTDLVEHSELPSDVRQAIGDGIRCVVGPEPFQPHPLCPCIRCMRAYGFVE